MSNGRARAWLVAVVALLASRAWAQANLFPAPDAEGTGEREMQAFAAAYPDRISGVEIHGGDVPGAIHGGEWALNVDGEWFSWSHGRILPEAQRDDWMKYARFRFYPYPLGGLPPLPTLDADSAARLRKLLEDSRAHPPRRSEAFLERLFRVGSRAQTLRRIVSVDFLGFHVQVNQRIAGALRDVATECESLRKSDPQCAAFLRSLAEVDGFNYRDVAGTLSRSYHGYGLAVDLIPKSYGGKAPYWRWVAERNAAAGAAADWWMTPYEQRWAVPLPLVAAFERHGFVWGGKWLFFDTMHFEYRPEILILAREAEASRSP